jgi:hypothetical protein
VKQHRGRGRNNPCTNGKRKILSKCQGLKAQDFFSNCISRVNPEKYFDFCKIDMCDCDPSQSCYCDSFTAYFYECSRNGVVIRPQWREQSKCTLNQLMKRSDYAKKKLGHKKTIKQDKSMHKNKIIPQIFT